MGPMAPVETAAPWARLTDTIEVLNTAGKPEKAPAKRPNPLELIQLLMTMQAMQESPRRKWMRGFTRFLPFGVGGSDQHRQMPITTHSTITQIEKSQIGTPRSFVKVSIEVTRNAAMNHATMDNRSVIHVTAVLL